MKDAQFHRIRRLPPYVFSEVNAMKAAARAAGDDIIDFGMGNPDGATTQLIVDKLIDKVIFAGTPAFIVSSAGWRPPACASRYASVMVS